MLTTSTIQRLIGQEITAITRSDKELWVFIGDRTELRLSNRSNAWQLEEADVVSISSADFHVGGTHGDRCVRQLQEKLEGVTILDVQESTEGDLTVLFAGSITLSVVSCDGKALWSIK